MRELLGVIEILHILIEVWIKGNAFVRAQEVYSSNVCM